MENYDRQQESVEQADANAGDVEHIEITLEEAAAMEKEYERLEMQRFAERALEREQLRAEELERDGVITKAREVAMEPENMERYRWQQDMYRRAEESQMPKLDAEERQERLAKFGEEWLKREQQQQERSQQPVEKTAEPEDLGEYVQSQYKWAKDFLSNNSPEDQKWLVENDSKFREDWLAGQPPDDPLAKEIQERFPMREEKHMDEPVNDPGAGDAVKTGVDENDIEMPPEYVGRAGAARGGETIEMPPDYVGQTGANTAGDDVEIDIDLLERLEKYNKELEGEGFSKLQREDLLRKYKDYDTELEGKGYEELSSIYKEVIKDTPDYRVAYKDDPNWIDKQDLRDFEG